MAEEKKEELSNLTLPQVIQRKLKSKLYFEELENFDKAFSRRFNYKIEFKRPDREQRKRLWDHLLPANITLESTRESFIAKLCEYDLSGGQIKLIVRNTAYKVATRQKPVFLLRDFDEEVKRELNANFDSQKSMGFMRG